MNAIVTAARGQISDLIDLTKPRITLLVLVTAFTGMWFAAGGLPPLGLTFFTLLGIGLASAASAVLNNYIDREVDGYMERTRNRALADGRLLPQHALRFGLSLAILAFGLLFYAVNPLTAVLAVATIFFYVCIYTLWLKRYSSLCTEIGGVAGAMPPVLGWVAVTNGLGWPALWTFIIMMLWQPPHFWALALLRVDEYRLAGLKMLPVTHGEAVTKRRMLVYTVALLPATVAMYSLNLTGPFYLVVALGCGILYLVKTIKFTRNAITPQGARRLFAFSILYLSVLFVMMFVDCSCGDAVF